MSLRMFKPSNETYTHNELKEEKPAPESECQQKIFLVERDGKYLLMAEAPHIENLAFKAGGTRGASYIGAVAALENAGILPQVKRVIGASAGSMIALLIALGYSTQEIITLCENINFSDITGSWADIIANREINSPNASLGKHVGVFSPNKALATFRRIIFDRISAIRKKDPANFNKIFSDLAKRLEAGQENHDAIITFNDLYLLKTIYPQENLRDLFIVATDIDSKTARAFSWEMDPDMEIALAIIASIGLPKIFTTIIQYDGHEYHDGGTTSLLPIEKFDDPRYYSAEYPFAHSISDKNTESTPVNLSTLGIGITKDNEANQLFEPDPPPDTLLQWAQDRLQSYISPIIAHGVNYHENWKIEKKEHIEKYPQRMILPRDYQIPGLSDLREDQRNALIVSGYEATEEWLKNHEQELMLLGVGNTFGEMIKDLDYNQLIILSNLLAQDKIQFDFSRELSDIEKKVFRDAVLHICHEQAKILYPPEIRIHEAINSIKKFLNSNEARDHYSDDNIKIIINALTRLESRLNVNDLTSTAATCAKSLLPLFINKIPALELPDALAMQLMNQLVHAHLSYKLASLAKAIKKINRNDPYLSTAIHLQEILLDAAKTTTAPDFTSHLEKLKKAVEKLGPFSDNTLRDIQENTLSMIANDLHTYSQRFLSNQPDEILPIPKK